jgi:Rod binding domain-containing protein
VPAAGDLPLEQLAKAPGVSEAAKVAEATRQFEAILVRQLLRSARQSSQATDAPGGTVAADIYWDLVHENLADAITRGGGLGLGTALQSSFGVTTPKGQGIHDAKLPADAAPGGIRSHLRDAEVADSLPPVALRRFAPAPMIEALNGSPDDEPESTGITHP